MRFEEKILFGKKLPLFPVDWTKRFRTANCHLSGKAAHFQNIRNVGRAVLNSVFEITVRRVNKCLDTGGGHF
jgi:hypothetical protein